MKKHYLAFLIAAAFFWSSCKQRLEEFDSGTPVKDFVLTTPGSYIIYQLDSTVYTNFGRNTEVRSYQEKHLVDAKITDNIGRPSYRFIRQIKTGNGPWVAGGTYFITPTDGTLEIVQDNQRIVKLAAPAVQNKTWKGNTYLTYKPYSGLYSFNNDIGMQDWNFFYKSTKDTFNYNSTVLQNVLHVQHVDEEEKEDTITVTGNRVTIPDTVQKVWLRGGGPDTITVTAGNPKNFSTLSISNHTGVAIKLNGIAVPTGFGFSFQYNDDKWGYPNPVPVVNNRATLQGGVNLVYLMGTATDKVIVNTQNVLSKFVKAITIHNKTNQPAYANFNAQLANEPIPPGKGRAYAVDTAGVWQSDINGFVIKQTDSYNQGTSDASKTFSQEKWAPGIGMVYQQLTMWQFVANPGADPYRLGFSVRRRMIELRKN